MKSAMIKSLLARRWIIDVVLLAALVAGAMFGWQQYQTYQDGEDENRDRQKVMDVASAQVSDLTTLSQETLDEQLEALESRSVGDFKEQLGALASTFTAIVADSKVTSDGEITGAAVSSFDGDTADVLVAATATVSTEKQRESPRVQRYRILVSLERAGGDWLIAGMEFVA